MDIKIKKLHKNAKMPFRATSGDAGADLTAISVKVEGNIVTYDIGLAFEIPKGYYGLITNRSSVKNYDLIINQGVIDSGYRGSVKVVFNRTGGNIYTIGDRVAQLLILPCQLCDFEEVQTLEDSERGEGGFGHSGK